MYIDNFISFASRSSLNMGEKRGRIPAVASHLIDDEILNHKNQILGDLQINEAEGKCKSNIILYIVY